jgi:transposase
MDRADLQGYLDRGLSFEAIARLVGRDPSTVAYWAKKYGLKSSHAERHAARGPIPRERLEALVEQGLTVRELAAAVDRSTATVRHWLRKYGLASTRARKRHTVIGIGEDGTVTAKCPVHGSTPHVIDRAGHFRCPRCRVDSVVRRRRRVKEILVEEAGGCCQLCGYARSVAALEFHHVDPTTKSFGLAVGGLTRSIAACRAEARKCVLLCSNCHAEVEAGVTALPLPSPESDPG